MMFEKYLTNLLKYMRSGGLVYAPVSFCNANERFVNKVVLVIGGSTGIGLEIAKQFVNEKASVIITALREDCLIDAVEKIHSDKLKYIVWDPSDVSCFNTKIQEALSLFGGIDIFVNNAGVIKYDSFNCYDEIMYDNMLDTNAKGLFFLCQAEGKYLVGKKKRGKIINVCSCFGVDARFDPHSVSKWGAVCITKGLAKELVDKGIIVNGVSPGSVPTIINDVEMVNSKEYACTPEHPSKLRELTEEVASLMLFLASDSSNSIVGQVITVDADCNLL